MGKLLPLGLILGLVVLTGCAGILPGGGGDYNPQPGCIGIQNPNTCVAHVMVFEGNYGNRSNRLLTWRQREDGTLTLEFRKSPISFDGMGYMEGINHSPANIWKMVIRPQVLQNTAVQVLHLIPDRRYTLVVYFTYAVSNNLIPIYGRMFWFRGFYVPAELRAYRDAFGEVSWLSAFIRLPKVNTQTISGRFCPKIEIHLP